MQRILILFLVVINCVSCVTPHGDAPAASISTSSHRIYLVSHGWHAGIVLAQKKIPSSVWPVTGDFPNVEYLEVGWGDQDYYQTPDAHMGTLLKAALLPTASILHIAGFNGPVRAHFPYSEIIEIGLSADEFRHLTQAIADSFSRNEAGKVMLLGHGLYGNGQFYRSRETYHLFNNCNTWTARMLNIAGLPLKPGDVVTVEDLMSQVREFGIVVQSNEKTNDK